MTRRGDVAGALAVLVLLVVPLGLVPYVLAPLGADEPRAPSPARLRLTGDPAVAAAMTCSDPAKPATDVPGDVVAARMCATDNDLQRWYAPLDSLHADLDRLVELLGTLEPMPESTEEQRYYCTDDGGYGFDLRLALTSGEIVSIPGDTGGCSTVRIGGEDVVGSDEVMQTFLDSLLEQRATTEPTDDLESLDLGCGSPDPFQDHVLSQIGDARDLVRAVSCWRPDSGDDVPPWVGPRPVEGADVATLVADMQRHIRRDRGWNKEPCRDRRVVWQDLVGQTRWGDVVAVRGVCRTYLLSDLSDVESDDQEFWYPSPDAQRILDGLRR